MRITCRDKRGGGVWLLVFLLAAQVSHSFSQSHYWLKKLKAKKVNDSNCPGGCVCHTKQLFCDAGHLKKLPRRYPEDVETIHFRDNLVRKVRFVHLRGLHRLKHLILKGNRISHVEPKALIDLYHLVSLSLTENNLRFLSPDTFNSQSRLQVLSLRRNKLRDAEQIFWPLESIRLLNLAHNRIKQVTHKTFRGNYQLRVLDLNDNRIRHIDKHSFKHMPFLRFLVLRDNPLKSVELDFRQNLHLELLDFTNCKLRDMVKGMPFSINDLRLSENNITRINEHDFRTIRKVRIMVLNDNKISYIHPLAFAKLWQLYALYIGANRLSVFPANLPKTINAVYANYNKISRVDAEDLSYRPQLQTVFLKNNNITYIDQKAFWGLFKLENLDLRENGIRMMKPGMFKDASLLQKLDLSSNPIREMESDCFQGLSNLNILVMSSVGNESNIEPSIFKETKNLKFLDLSNSSRLAKQMTARPAILEYIKTVENLNMMEDDLDTLPSDFPKHFPQIQMVKLVGNPWHCDHKLLWMRDWMHNRSIEFFSPDEMICTSPPHLQGVKIEDLTEQSVHAPWIIDQPIITTLNISDKYQKVFLGNDGKWYFFNEALSPDDGVKGNKYEIFRNKGGKFNGVLTKVPSDIRPGPPYVHVKPVKAFGPNYAGKQNDKRKSRRRGKTRRGKNVAALNAAVAEPITQTAKAQTERDITLDKDRVNPTWKPAPPLRNPLLSGTDVANTKDKEGKQKGSDTLQHTVVNTDTPATPFQIQKQSHTHRGTGTQRVSTTGGSPLFDDSSGFVSGEDSIEMTEF